MKTQKKSNIFKKGIWIKEQQGTLTMGSMDDPAQTVIVPDEMHKIIQDFETDMVEALYGESRRVFTPDILDIKVVIRNLKKQFSDLDLKISFADGTGSSFKGKYEDIYNFLEKLVSSCIPEDTESSVPPVIYINASILDNHLCIIFRDSLSISSPQALEKEIAFVEAELKGKVSYKSTSTSKSYYDIMIPSQK